MFPGNNSDSPFEQDDGLAGGYPWVECLKLNQVIMNRFDESMHILGLEDIW